jgi:glycerol-3-phosphate dehydrogenase
MSRTSGHDGAVTVFGAGAWGTVLAAMLARGATRVTLWARRPDQAAALSRTRENPAYLPGFPLPDNVDVTADVTAAAKAAELAIVAVPSRAVRALVRALPGNALPGSGGSPLALVLAAKGIEATRFRRLSEVVADERPGTPVAVLSGPNLAAEIAAGKPAAATVASHDGALAQRVQDLFRPSHLRVYTSADVVGVEVPGALKNVIALAAGMSDGLGLGDNGKAALIARGLAEIEASGLTAEGIPHRARRSPHAPGDGRRDAHLQRGVPGGLPRRIGRRRLARAHATGVRGGASRPPMPGARRRPRRQRQRQRPSPPAVSAGPLPRRAQQAAGRSSPPCRRRSAGRSPSCACC